MIQKTAEALLPTKYGEFRIVVYQAGGSEHVALVHGDIQNPMLVRLHSSCVTGDIFFSLKCDCGQQLEKSMEKIQQNGSGIIVYLNQEGRGIGLTNKIRAYALQEKGYDTVEANEMLGFPADARNYQLAADIVKDLGVTKVYLLTNNPDKQQQLTTYGIEILERFPLEIKPNSTNRKYLETKKHKLSHQLLYV